MERNSMFKRRWQVDSAKGHILYHRALELEKERVYSDAEKYKLSCTYS